MALKSALAFSRDLIDVASREKKIKTVSLRILDSIVVKSRFKLNSRFIDVFYNSRTGITAYALIENELPRARRHGDSTKESMSVDGFPRGQSLGVLSRCYIGINSTYDKFCSA